MMLNLDSIKFSTAGWTFDEDKKVGLNTTRTWSNKQMDILSLHCFPKPDPSPFELGNIDAFRDFCREMALHNGNDMIEADIITPEDLTFYRMIYKYQKEPTGFTFSGGLCLSPHFVVNVEAFEGPLTGIRETAVANFLGPEAKPGFISRLFRGKKAWAGDPYDQRRNGGYFKSDAREWDSSFPEHPLSRVREHLAVIGSTVKFKGSTY
jgi:hypothetical protein